MANENPSGDRPDTPTPPTGSHERPESLRSPEDWLAAEESSAHEPLHLPEEALFDDLVEEAGPPLPDTEHDDGLIDFTPSREDIDSASISAPSELLSDPGDILSDLPPFDSATPGSGWFGHSGDEIHSTPDEPNLSAETSDVIAGHRRDLDLDNEGQELSNSSIFDITAEGSGRFARPDDRTDAEAAGPASGLYLDAEEPSGSSGELFGDSIPGAEDLERDAAALLANLPPLPTGPERPDNSDVVDLGSGVDLLDPEKGSGVLGGGSSIFGAVINPDSELDRAAESTGRSRDVHGKDADPDSNIFRSGSTQRGDSSVRVPEPFSGDPPADDDASGLVDWGVPGSTPRLTDRMTAQEAAAAGVPDLRTLAETPRPAARLDDPRPGRKRPDERPQPAAKHEAPRKSGTLGWIGGTAVGLFVGLGLGAGAYFSGLLGDTDSKPRQAVQGASNPADRQRIDDLTAQLDEAKSGIDTARTERNQAITNQNAAQARLSTAQKDATTARTERDRAKSDAKTAADQLTAARGKADTLTTKVTAMQIAESEQKQLLATKEKERMAAEARAVEASAKLKSADDALAGVVKELRANKLLDEKDDAATAVAKLPDVLKKAAAAAASSDAQKAAAAVLAAKKEAEDAKNALADAEKALATARAEVKTAVAAAESATATKLAAAEERAREALKERQQAEKAYATKLEALESEFVKRLADARSGVVIPLSTGEIAAKERAATAYNVGVDLYFVGRSTAAEAAFTRATEADASDARYWYFLGLARYARGNKEAANEAFKKGGDLEGRNQPPSRAVTVALERIQGPARWVLDQHRP